MPRNDTPSESALAKLFEDLSEADGTSALERLGRMLYAIPAMTAREVPVIWYMLEVSSPNVVSAASKQALKALRSALWARMRQILNEEATGWGDGDISQVQEIVMANAPKTVPVPAKKSWLRRIRDAA